MQNSCQRHVKEVVHIHTYITRVCVNIQPRHASHVMRSCYELECTYAKGEKTDLDRGAANAGLLIWTTHAIDVISDSSAARRTRFTEATLERTCCVWPAEGRESIDQLEIKELPRLIWSQLNGIVICGHTFNINGREINCIGMSTRIKAQAIAGILTRRYVRMSNINNKLGVEGLYQWATAGGEDWRRTRRINLHYTPTWR